MTRKEWVRIRKQTSVVIGLGLSVKATLASGSWPESILWLSLGVIFLALAIERDDRPE